jgi:hypothetical protein
MKDLLMSPEVEPRGDHGDHALVPDIAVVSRGTFFLLDVSVTNPSAPSYRAIASHRKLSAALRRENEKRVKYQALADTQGAIFVPFVFESHGAMAAQASRFLLRIAEDAPHTTGESPEEFRARAMHVLNVALHRGNGLIISKAVSVLANAARHGGGARR